MHARAIAPNEIKSATDNQGTFDGGSSDITFNVVGPTAKNWDKIKHRAFKGRDDGKERVEIDASRATLKSEALRGKNLKAYRQIIADWNELPEAERKEVEAYAELCAERDEAANKLNETTENDFQEAYAAANKLADEVNSKRVKVREIIGEFFKMKGADGSVGITAKNEIIDAMAVDFWGEWGSDKVENSLASAPMAMGMKLLDYYPKEKHEHDIEFSEMMQLPTALADPVCIVESDTPGCVEVVIELKEGVKNVLVAVQLNGLQEGSRTQRVNRIASLYGKNQINAILTHTRLYWNKAKARIWTGGGGLQSSTAPYPKRASVRKVLKPEDLVKYKMEKGLTFSMERMQKGDELNRVQGMSEAECGRFAGRVSSPR